MAASTRELLPHLALFLDTRPRPEEDETSDILYAYPPPEKRTLNQASLERLKGVFVALNGVMRMLTGQPVTTASIEQHQEDRALGGTGTTRSIKLIAAYAQMESALFVAVVPRTIPEPLVAALVREFLSSLRFIAGPLEAFVRGPEGGPPDPGRPARLASILDPLCARFFEVALSEEALQHGFFAALDMGAKFFNPSMEVRSQLGDALNSLTGGPSKSIDYVTSGGRSCVPLGAAVFHRGVLVASTMGAGDLRDAARFCGARRLFGAPADAGETVIVHEVYREGPAPEKAREGPVPPGATHRCVLVAVAQSQQLLCLLLYPRWPVAGQLDPYMVADCKATLHRLRASGRFRALDALMAEKVPAVVDLWSAAQEAGAAIGADLLRSLFAGSVPQPEPQAATLLDPKRWAAAAADPPWRATAGRPNVLLHYVAVYPPAGTLTAPLLPAGSAAVPPLLAAARREFFRAYAAIRAPLARARPRAGPAGPAAPPPPARGAEESRAEAQARGEAERAAKFAAAGGPGAAAGVREVGALLTPMDDPRHAAAFVATGRAWGRDGTAEVFMACHAAVPQSAADVALRLTAGARLS